MNLINLGATFILFLTIFIFFHNLVSFIPNDSASLFPYGYMTVPKQNIALRSMTFNLRKLIFLILCNSSAPFPSFYVSLILIPSFNFLKYCIFTLYLSWFTATSFHNLFQSNSFYLLINISIYLINLFGFILISFILFRIHLAFSITLSVFANTPFSSLRFFYLSLIEVSWKIAHIYYSLMKPPCLSTYLQNLFVFFLILLRYLSIFFHIPY